MFTSSSAMSGFNARAAATASGPSAASAMTVKPSPASASRMPARTAAWSSASNTVIASELTEDHLDLGSAPWLRRHVDHSPAHLSALAHAGQAKAAPTRFVRIEALSVITDSYPDRVGVGQRDEDGRRLTVACRVRDRLAHDPRKVLAYLGRHMDARREIETDVCPGTRSDVLRCLSKRHVERLVDVAAERRDRGARLVEGALGRCRDFRERTRLAALLDQRSRLTDDECELLRQPVVQVARDPAALAGRRRL